MLFNITFVSKYAYAERREMTSTNTSDLMYRLLNKILKDITAFNSTLVLDHIFFLVFMFCCFFKFKTDCELVKK